MDTQRQTVIFKYPESELRTSKNKVNDKGYAKRILLKHVFTKN